jgi:hypothetical protein
MRMNVPLARRIVAGGLKALSEPSKMPGAAYGLPADCCQRGRKLAKVPGSVCSQGYCHQGRYRFQTVRAAQLARLVCLEDSRWSEAMAFLLNCFPYDGHFRWFDCGDLQGVGHLEKIVDVCLATPDMKHWLPTHEPFMVGAYLETGGELPDNLCIRISADMIEDRPTTPTWGLPTSTVHRWKGEPVPAADGDRRKSIECRAYLRGHKCGPCRACWDPRVANVSYPLK